MNNLQDVDLNIFSRIKRKKIPNTVKLGVIGFFVLIILIFLLVYLSKFSQDDSRVKEPEISVSPTLAEDERDLTENQRRYLETQKKLEEIDPYQKKLLPPQINLNLEFENE